MSLGVVWLPHVAGQEALAPSLGSSADEMPEWRDAHLPDVFAATPSWNQDTVGVRTEQN